MTDMKKKTETTLLKSIVYWDEYISHTISGHWQNPSLLKLMKWVSNPPHWRQILSVITIFLFLFGAMLTKKRIIVLLFSIILSDQTCNLIKAATKRLRPYGSDFSFPSAHTANMFTAAVLLEKWLPIWNGFFYVWASLVAFSRVYLKKHYLLDVVMGGIIGVAYALAFLVLL